MQPQPRNHAGIFLEYERKGKTATKCIDLLDLDEDADLDELISLGTPPYCTFQQQLTK